MINSMVAKHALWPKEDDAIFGLAAKAKEAIKKYGADKVIDSTLGALADDNGNLICMKTVYDELKSMPNAEIAAYAMVAGQPAFLEAVQKACFREFRPDAYIKAVATPGGSGSVKHAICNYSNPGDSILVCDWFWKPYVTISEEIGRNVVNYQLFNDKNEFNIESFKENFELLLNKQKRLVTIINSPAQNPTGYSLTDEEWKQVLDIMKENAKNEENKIILLVDVAYIDFAGKGNEKRKFFTQFSNLPENIFTIIGYSLSKGYTMYGMRLGAAIGISSNEDIADEFYYSCMHSGRANWSNCNRGAMEVMTRISNDINKSEAYEAEKAGYKAMLQRRADTFVKASQDAGLEILPYRDGFFISIPCDNAKAVSDKLMNENLFLIPLKKGLRFAVCAVSEEKCKKAPEMIKKAMARI
ncbi:MAG: aminotransferase class I/II-fold pyridoxal phosphate-dependent enzyme [Lutispora sp.]